MLNPSGNGALQAARGGNVASAIAAAGCRTYGTRTGLDITLPTRRGMFSDIPVVSSMLPNRKNMAAQFTPHGIMLVPKAIFPDAPGSCSDLVQQGQDGTTLSPVSKAATQQSTIQKADDQEQETDEGTLLAISIKRWRKLKLKKHKIKKRRKANRYKNTSVQ